MLVWLACLGLSPTPAGAEGAWVLWSEEWTTTPTADGRVYLEKNWSLLGAEESKMRCQAEAAARAATMLRSVPDAKHAGNTLDDPIVLIIAPDGIKKYLTFFKCLPDSVDPRGPKGK
jgi:hypothetical protein